MTAMQGALSAAERSMRSVFVGNIPYEATEEQLKDIFAEVGPVVSFRLVYDRETGKPKGYGFCEYKDQEMALSAMRNLNSYELNGRALRVDNAASEKSKEELKNLQASLGGPPVESPYGPDVAPDKAPEAISKVMCSVPPEQLYELMIQMKMCIESNPNEARTLLIQNPQLAYALLQAQVIMKMVDSDQAKSMLHGPSFQPPPAGALLPTPDPKAAPVSTSSGAPPVANEVQATFPSTMPPAPMQTNPAMPTPRPTHPVMPLTRPALLGERPQLLQERMPFAPPNQQFQEKDSRALGDHDLRQMPMIDRDMRGPPMLTGDKDMRQPTGDQDLRLGGPGGFDPRFRNAPGPDGRPVQGPPDQRHMQGPPDQRHMQGPPDQRLMQGPPDQRHMQGLPDQRHMQGPPDQRHMQGPHDQRLMQGPPDNRSMQAPLQGPPTRNLPGMGAFDNRNAPMVSPRMEDQRGPVQGAGPNMPMARGPQNPRISAIGGGSPAIGGASPNPMSSPRPANQLAAAAAAISPHDQEKAALIMQVLQLSDQQIAQLPPEQRQSIMILKEQIARSR